MAERSIEYFFTPTSPWTYLGHPRFYAITSCYELTVVMKPCDLGKVFSVSGGLPLKQRPQQRQDYRLVELKRWREFLGTKLNLEPKHFPVPADRAAQAIIAVDLAYHAHAAMSFAFAVMRACWAEDRNIDDDATLTEIARGVGLDPASLASDELRAKAKARYEANTQEAMQRGVFGAPWYVYAGEPFWGQDRLDLLERAIAASARES
jgi:2-hydroxychromene-2-carboxylate isomerase